MIELHQCIFRLLDEFVLLVDAYHLNRLAAATVVVDHILEALALGVDEPAQMVDDDMIHRTAVALQDHHSTAIGAGIHLLPVAGVAQFAAIDNSQLAVHALTEFQCPRGDFGGIWFTLLQRFPWDLNGFAAN